MNTTLNADERRLRRARTILNCVGTAVYVSILVALVVIATPITQYTSVLMVPFAVVTTALFCAFRLAHRTLDRMAARA